MTDSSLTSRLMGFSKRTLLAVENQVYETVKTYATSKILKKEELSKIQPNINLN